MEIIWLVLVAGSMAVAVANGRAEVAVNEALRSAAAAVETTLGFLGAMCLWLGLMKIAERSGLAAALSRLVSPLLRLVMPSVPPDHPAFGAVSMSISANLLGLGSAATPFGFKAMEELKRLAESDACHRPRAGKPVDSATPAMCTFVAMTCAGLTLVPGAVVALRAQMGSSDPSATVGPTILAGLVAWMTVLVTDSAFRRRWG
ncbi:MAG: spore maturation protein [Firmicutes bacterium]|nr:spore maturation protein [Bacillota bacterium]